MEFSIAQLSALVMNIAKGVWGGKGSKKQSTALDFLPKWYEPEKQEVKKQSVEDMKKFLLDFAKANNKRRGGRK